MKRVITFRLLPSGKKERLLKEIGAEMATLGNYVIDTYMNEIHEEGASPTKFGLAKFFCSSKSQYYLDGISETVKKGYYYESIIEKVLPNLKNYLAGRTKKPVWKSMIHFRTRLVKFTRTDAGYWGVSINHPSERGGYIFIKIAEGEKLDELVETVEESGAEDTFTCEIHKTYSGKWILSAMIDIGDAPGVPSDVDYIVGVDRGLRHVAVASVLDRDGNVVEVKFFRGGTLFKKRKELDRRLREVQRLGKKKTFDRLKNKDGEIVKLKNHEVSKGIVELAKKYRPSAIVFEDLKGSKDSMKTQSFKESGDIKGKGGRFKNRILSWWSPSMLMEFVEYKAEEAGIPVYQIDPKYTSQTCPKCGYKDRSNRKASSHRFVCGECKYELNDDLVGAINIGLRGDAKISA